MLNLPPEPQTVKGFPHLQDFVKILSMEASEQTEITCPYCAQGFGVEIDHTGGEQQEWITDCEVCCRPIVVRFHFEDDELVGLEAHAEQD